MKARSKLIASILVGHAILLGVWISFRLTDHDYIHIWLGSPFHIAVAHFILWPYYILNFISPDIETPWIVYSFIYVVDGIVYSGLGYVVVSFIRPEKKATYFDEI